jgi:cytochrome P450
MADLSFPSIAGGVIARRPSVLRLLERTQAESRVLTRMRLLRREFGRGPVELVIPGRRIIVILDPNEVATVLAESPTPFDPANREKRKALQWFEPHGVLISRGPIRQQRRAVNEGALDTPLPLHRLADTLAGFIAEEARELIDRAIAQGHLDSMHLRGRFTRLARRLTLGDRARGDDVITLQLMRLRRAGNWSFLGLPHHRLRDQFIERLYRYVENPEPGTLAHALAEVPAGGAVDPVGQIPQWLFAFDAAGFALLRALALLATHPAELQTAIADSDAPDHPPLVRPYLRACALESVRLWPTTPVILRDTTEDTDWDGANETFTIGKGAAVLIVTPAFHRDPQLLPFANQFAPQIWLDGTAQKCPQLVPFSAGPAECPGRNLVLFVASTLMAHLLNALDFRLISQPALSPDQPLPMTLNQLALDFEVRKANREVPSTPIPHAL